MNKTSPKILNVFFSNNQNSISLLEFFFWFVQNQKVLAYFFSRSWFAYQKIRLVKKIDRQIKRDRQRKNRETDERTERTLKNFHLSPDENSALGGPEYQRSLIDCTFVGAHQPIETTLESIQSRVYKFVNIIDVNLN